MKKPVSLFSILILFVFSVLIYFFVRGLGHDPSILDSVVVGKNIQTTENVTTDTIEFSLPTLEDGTIVQASDMPKTPYLINIWGTWCPACYIEHPYLIELGKIIPIIGINWPANNPDEHTKAKQFLKEKGNPYQQVLVDDSGQFIINLGVYGAPETFLISADGKILKRYAGIMTPEIWQNEFQPLIPQ